VIGFERYGALGGSVGAIGVVAAIFAAWLFAQPERLQDRRLEDRHVNGQLRLIGNTVSQFDPLVQQYIKLALEKDPKVTDYYVTRIDDPRLEKMTDLNAMPTSHWPSAEIYHAFNEYLFSAITLMETSADEQTSIKLPDRISAYRRKFEALKRALDTPGGSLAPGRWT
jgi:hypothetical protein